MTKCEQKRIVAIAIESINAKARRMVDEVSHLNYEDGLKVNGFERVLLSDRLGCWLDVLEELTSKSGTDFERIANKLSIYYKTTSLLDALADELRR